MCSRATRLSLSLLLSASTLTATAQRPVSYPSRGYQAAAPHGVVLRPVPRESARVATPPAPANPQHEGWDLRWRRSPQVAASRHSQALESGSPASAPTGNGGSLEVADRAPQLRPVHENDVAQATWLAHPQRDDLFAPPADLQPPSSSSKNPPRTELNFFDDPFGDDELPAGTPKPVSTAADETIPARDPRGRSCHAQRFATDERPSRQRPNAAESWPFIPSDSGSSDSAPATQAPVTQAPGSRPAQIPLTPAPAARSSQPPSASKSRADNGPSLGEMLRNRQPTAPQRRSTVSDDLQGSEELLLPAPRRTQPTPHRTSRTHQPRIPIRSTTRSIAYVIVNRTSGIAIVSDRERHSTNGTAKMESGLTKMTTRIFACLPVLRVPTFVSESPN